MNPVALYLASGESLYAGAAVLFIAMAVSFFVRGRWPMRLRNWTAWAGLLLMALACAPAGWWAYVGILLLFLAWLGFWNANWSTPIVRVGSASLLALAVLGLVAWELPHRQLRPLTGEKVDHLVVIGDSISSGLETGFPPWPGVLQNATGVSVINLARPGIDTEEAIPLARKVTPQDHLIIIEIGGNDLIANVPTASFAQALSTLLERLDQPGRRLVMFELPLLPHKIGYGRVQRRLAAEHHVLLIPKRYFVDVVAAKNATSDGLHLSPRGAASMAALVQRVVGPVLKPARGG